MLADLDLPCQELAFVDAVTAVPSDGRLLGNYAVVA